MNSEFNGKEIIIALAVAGLFIMLLVENCRVPVDDPNTHLELTMIHEVMILDNSGPDLGLIMYASMLKMTLFAALISNLILTVPMESTLYFPLHCLSILAISICIGIVESVMARLRMSHIPQFALIMISIGLLIMSVGALGLIGGLK